MKTAETHGLDVECEVTGSGEPVLLISPDRADGFVPLVSEPALTAVPPAKPPRRRLR